MRLTAHTDYALRLLMLLALEPEELHTIEEIARRYDISRNHMMKVALRLTQAGFVESVRGRSGGLKLAQPAERIGLGDVVRATEDSLAIVECFDRERNGCIVSSACGLRSVLNEALAAFFDVLDGYTLADLIGKPDISRRMRRLLADGSPATR